MATIIKFILMVLIMSPLVFGSPSVFAKRDGEDHQGREGMPAGFDQGEKKGWGDSQTPPGWTEGEKKGWEEGSTPPGLTEDKTRKKEKKAKHHRRHKK